MSPPDTPLPPLRERVGAVVIGKNEGGRLDRALEAVADRLEATVYVDSDSSDGSRERAAPRGVEVIHLREGPFTPSRGRQVGFEALLARRPDLEFVQFLDGDCVVRPDWIEAAVHHLDAHPGVAAVCGRRREERTAASFWSRLMDVDWEGPSGEASHFGGDSLVRVAALRAAGGWSPNTINAEDVEVSFRLRAAGGRIERLGREMTLHDVRMTRFGEYWRRSLRAGYGYAEVGWRFRHGPGRLLLRRMASALLYGAVLPVVAVVGAWVWWPLAVGVALLYARLVLQLARFARERGAHRRLALAYGLLNALCKVAAALGVARYALDRLRGRDVPRDHLIVYRGQGPR
jgi:GT2 family glycosyltransferase